MADTATAVADGGRGQPAYLMLRPYVFCNPIAQ
jgi:hypothetical protein